MEKLMRKGQVFKTPTGSRQALVLDLDSDSVLLSIRQKARGLFEGREGLKRLKVDQVNPLIDEDLSAQFVETWVQGIKEFRAYILRGDYIPLWDGQAIIAAYRAHGFLWEQRLKAKEEIYQRTQSHRTKMHLIQGMGQFPGTDQILACNDCGYSWHPHVEEAPVDEFGLCPRCGSGDGRGIATDDPVFETALDLVRSQSEPYWDEEGGCVAWRRVG